MKDKIRNIIGYTWGFVVFVCLIPFLMWLVSDRAIQQSSILLILSVAIMLCGLLFALWTVVYMRNVGKGNPADVFNNAIGTHTKHLMTQGPYRFCRNPMVMGMDIFYVGFAILLNSWISLVIPIVLALIMLVQIINFEEKRLEKDFGEEFLRYKKTTSRFFPIKYIISHIKQMI